MWCAQAAAFAYRDGRHTGSLACLRAILFILRNRVKSGWGGGSWLAVVEAAGETSGHLAIEPSGDFQSPDHPIAQSSDRLLLMIVRDVDDIYLGQESFDDPVRQVCSRDAEFASGRGPVGMKKDWHPVLYYSFVDRPARPWFVESIIRKPQEHPQVGQVGGKMMLYR
jgi:hypothetical protein